MMDIQAALGLHQIERLPRHLERRNAVWTLYDTAFQDLPLSVPTPAEPDTVHARHLYTVLLDVDRLRVGRDAIQEALYHENIGTGVHYVSLHLHEFYRETFGYRPEDFPNARHISDRTLSLPLSPKLSDEDVGDVIAAVRKVLTKHLQ